MDTIKITTLERLVESGLDNFEINKDTSVEIKIRLEDNELDFPVRIVHKLPGLRSEINIKFVLYGHSRVKVPVEILVEKGAVETSTRFKALVLLMSPYAHAIITPGLLIHEKNILAASHGVVIKNIKDRDLVYLRSRGLIKESAREIIAQMGEK